MGMRAGSRALAVFGYSLNAEVLSRHGAGPLASRELRETLEWAPSTSLRTAVAGLVELGALDRDVAGEGRPARTTWLTEAGRGLLDVGERLRRWLEAAPAGPVPLGDRAGIRTVRALLDGWDSGIVCAVAAAPRTAWEVRRRVDGVSGDSVERRLQKMRAAELLVRCGAEGGRRPLEATGLLRRSVAPLSAALLWERRHLTARAPLGRTEARATYLLMAPLLELPAGARGSCAAVMLTDRTRGAANRGSESEIARVSFVIGEGTARAIRSAALEPGAWILGTADGWLRAIVEGDAAALRIRGADTDLATLLAECMHRALGQATPASPSIA